MAFNVLHLGDESLHLLMVLTPLAGLDATADIDRVGLGSAYRGADVLWSQSTGEDQWSGRIVRYRIPVEARPGTAVDRFVPRIEQDGRGAGV